MKKMIVTLSMCTLLACMIPILPIAVAEQTIILPGNEYDIRMTVQYDTGVDSRFIITLLDVPVGYDVSNQAYHGWCAQKELAMNTGVEHSIELFSSIDTLPTEFSSMPWDKINYILNNRVGYNKYSVQNAIWCFTDNANCSDDPDALALVAAANASGTGYVPQVGDIVAIPIKGKSTIQLSFLELVIPQPNSLRGLVWYDTNANGVQNDGEPGLKDVAVTLYTNSSTLVASTTSTSQGIYSFSDVDTGSYYLQFTLASGHKFSPKDNAADDTLDSDADTASGKTITFSVVSGNETITIWDAGMYVQSSGGQPSEPEPQTPANKRPTADATAGEPYRGFINTNITFNGSRSYDLDGRVITWRWSFGDLVNGTGEVTTHMYTTAGNYTVKLIVTDNSFAQDIYETYAVIALGNNAPNTPTITGPSSVHVNTATQYTITATDPDGDNLKYYIDWGDDIQEISPPVESGNSVQRSHQWKSVGFFWINVSVDDIYNETSPVASKRVAVGVLYAQSLGYFIDNNGDDVYEKFHSNETGVETAVKLQQGTGDYLIDTDGDGNWDMTVDPASGEAKQYTEQSMLLYAGIILVILIVLFIGVYLIVRRRRSRIISKSQSTDNQKKP